MATDMLAVPLKKSADVDIVTPLNHVMQCLFGAESGVRKVNYKDAINELSQLRFNAVCRTSLSERSDSSLEIMCSYYDQLCSLESKIPVQELQVPFKWKDAFDRGSMFSGRISMTLTSLPYEKVCVLFNIAALQSHIASSQSLDNDEGLRRAVNLLQKAAGIFSYLGEGVVSAIRREPTPDLKAETLAALKTLMLAQAQDIFVRKTILDNKNASVVAKLSLQAEELYGDTLKALQKSSSVQAAWDKEWIHVISGKQAAFHAVYQFYRSLESRENKMFGEEIARLRFATELFTASKNSMGPSKYFDEISVRVQINLNEATKNNDVIYNERIPDVKELSLIQKASLAKPFALPDRMSSSFNDLFQGLVPLCVHQAMAMYEVRRSVLVNGEITKLRQNTQILNNLLASLNLPAAIEKTTGSELPDSLLQKANTLRSLGGADSIKQLIKELPELFQRNQEILDVSDKMLEEECNCDRELRQEYNERWVRPPSEKLTEMFRTSLAKYRQIINNATDADGTVREKFEAHVQGMELLSKSNEELRDLIPATGHSVTYSNTASVQKLRELMKTVHDIKVERDAIESDLKSAKLDMRSEFLVSLAQDGFIDEPVMSLDRLTSLLGPLQRRVEESSSKQEELIRDIIETHEVMREGTDVGSRDLKMTQLASAFDAFMELQSNLQEGAQFYNDLTQLLVSFQNKIADYCFARATEKEELLKEMTALAIPTSSLPEEPIINDISPTPGCSVPLYSTYMAPPMPTCYNPYAMHTGFDLSTIPIPQTPQAYMAYVVQPGFYQPTPQDLCNPHQPQLQPQPPS